jgi:uncharacterized membrane protein YdjX (TVP38/TMEM64 family)
MKMRIKALVFAGVIISIILIIAFSGLGKYLTLQQFIQYQGDIKAFVASNYLLSIAAFIGIYSASQAFAIPGALTLTIIGGYLFGFLPGIIFVNIGATAGACAVFFITRYFIGKNIQKKYADKLLPFNREFEENGISYFLILRLVPLFPFFMVNLFAGLTNVSFVFFFLTTMIGIIPGSAVYVYAGTSLSSIHSIKEILSIKIVIALLLLALLSSVPLVYKKILPKGNRTGLKT